MANLQQIFNMILTGESVFALFINKADFDSARTSILRKFRNHKDALDQIGGDNPYEGQYIKCTFDPEAVSGTFHLEIEKRRSGIRGKSYNLKEL